MDEPALPGERSTKLVGPPSDRALKTIAFLSRLRVPAGELVGSPFVVQPFQRRFLHLAFAEGIRTAILSIARKNAKTALCAGIVLAGLIGPLARRNGQILSGARSRKQAAQVFQYVLQIIDLMQWRPFFRIQESSKQITCGRTGVVFQALSADAGTAHGAQPFLNVIDELGQVRGPTDPLYAAMTSATGAYENALSIIISTQAAEETALLSTLIDATLSGEDPTSAAMVFSAASDADPWIRDTWRQANPALGVFRSEADIESLAFKARLIPSLENEFRNLMLNQRVSLVATWLTGQAWEACAGEIDEELFKRGHVYAGLDLSSRNDLTSLALVVEDEKTGEIHARLYFWMPEHDIDERSRRERADYGLWSRDGYLELVEGKTINFAWIADRLAQLCQDLDVRAVAYDRWRIEILRQELGRIGAEAVVPLVPHGQGFKDMSPAVEEAESAIALEQLRHGGNPVLRYCIANTRLRTDPAGNRKPDKALSYGHIDGTVALLMAIRALKTEGTSPGLVETEGMIVLS